MGAGLSDVLIRLAARGFEKQSQGESFTPMPGGQPMPGGEAPQPPPGPGGAPMDPMTMATQGMDPAAIMAAQGQPVDPAMAAAGGAAMPAPGGAPAGGAAGAPPAPPLDPMLQQAIDAAVAKATGGGQGGGAAGAGGKAGGKNDMKIKLDEIHGLLNKMLGVMVGAGKLPASEIPELETMANGQPPLPQGADAIPPEQKAASLGEMTDTSDTVPEAKQEKVAQSLAQLILALKG